MRARREGIRRTAVGVVAGIGDELIVEGELGPVIQCDAVIGFENLLSAVVRQLTVAKQDAEPAGVEESNVGVRDAVDDAGDFNRVVGPTTDLPPIETPPDTVRSTSVKSHGSTLPSAQPARKNTPIFP